MPRIKKRLLQLDEARETKGSKVLETSSTAKTAEEIAECLADTELHLRDHDEGFLRFCGDDYNSERQGSTCLLT